MTVDEIIVPSLKELQDAGLINKTKGNYLRLKPNLIEDFPFIKNFDDETMSIYTAYYIFAIALNTDEYKRITRGVDFKDPSEEDARKIRDYYDESIIEWVRCLYELEENTDKDEISRYNSYLCTLKSQFIETKYTTKFMKDCYNENFRKAVKNYFYNNTLRLEVLDMDAEGDEVYENTLKCLYIMLSMDYKEDYDKNKRKLIKDFKSVGYEEASEMTVDYLSTLESLLYTKDMYLEQRHLRINLAEQVKGISDPQIKDNPHLVRK